MDAGICDISPKGWPTLPEVSDSSWSCDFLGSLDHLVSNGRGDYNHVI